MKNNQYDLTFGIDLGGTWVRLGLVKDKQLIKEWRNPTNPTEFESTLGPVVSQIKEWSKEFNAKKIFVGIASPGPLDFEKGLIVATLNLVGFIGRSFIEYFKKALAPLEVDVVVENDANTAALGQAIVEDDYENKVISFITLSTGIGMGHVDHGKIYHGAHGYGSEVANVVIDPNSLFSYSNHKPGTIETLTSGPAILFRAKKEGLNCSKTEDVFSEAKKGNQIAIDILESVKRYTAIFIGTIMAFYDPDILVFSGSVAMYNQDFYQKALDESKKFMFSSVAKEVKLRFAIKSESMTLVAAANLYK